MSTTGSFASEALQSIRLGVVTIFGIIAPGIWFFSTTLLYVTYLFGGGSLNDIQINSDFFISATGPYLASIIGILVVYVCGSVLRILPPDGPDRWSPLRKEKDSPIEKRERFPYENLPEYLISRGLLGLAELVPWRLENKEKPDVQIQRSKTFLHFIKLYITHKDPDMANYLAKQEAFIRLMSGVFYAAIYSSLIFLIFLVFRTRYTL